MKKFDRETERKIKNITQYIFAIVILIASTWAMFAELLETKYWLVCLFISIIILSESDITDLAEIWLNGRR